MVELLTFINILIDFKSTISDFRNFSEIDDEKQKGLATLFDFFILITEKLNLQNFHNFKYENQVTIKDHFKEIILTIQTFIQNQDINVPSNQAKLNIIIEVQKQILLDQENIIHNITSIISEEEDFNKATQLFNSNYFINDNLIRLYSIVYDLFSGNVTYFSNEDSVITVIGQKTLEDFLIFLTLILKKIDLNNFYNSELNNQVNLINTFEEFETIIEILNNKGFNKATEVLSTFVSTKQNIITQTVDTFIIERIKKIENLDSCLADGMKKFNSHNPILKKLRKMMKEELKNFYAPIKLLLSIENQNYINNFKKSQIFSEFKLFLLTKHPEELKFFNNEIVYMYSFPSLISSVIQSIDDSRFWTNYIIQKNLLNYYTNYYNNVDDLPNYIISIMKNLAKYNPPKTVKELQAILPGFFNRQYLFQILLTNYQEEYRALVENLANDSDINFNVVVDDHYQHTILMKAILTKNTQIVSIILNKCPKININAQDKMEKTALIHAVLTRNIEIVELVLKSPNIKLDIKDISGDNASEIADCIQRKDMAEMINDHFYKEENHQQDNFKPDPSHANSQSSKKRARYN